LGIKSKTISGLKWSFTDSIVNQIIQFVIGLILARLLSPSEYGIIGMAMVFISISEGIVNCCLGSALIRKQNCTDNDYNTMFYTNIILGIITFLILYFSAGAIARFYHNSDLILLTKIMAVNLIINSFGMVETAILTKRIDFKTQTKVSVISSSVSGVIGITLAFLGFGYWSLAIRTLSHNLLRVILLYAFSEFRPKLLFSIQSFKDLFGFGFKLLIAGLINNIYNNVYQLIIGRYFSPAELGYYSRAVQFQNLPSKNIDNTVQRVTYPVLANISNDNDKLKDAYKKLIKLLFYIVCFTMLIMIINAKEIILILIGQKWAPSIPYLQILCLSGILYPLHTINLNLLNAKGRSDLFLRLEIIKKLLVIPVIIIGIKFGMIVMLWGMVFNSIIAYLLNSVFSGKLIDYSTWKQILDILPTLINSAIAAILAFFIGKILPSPLFLSLILKTVIASGYIFAAGYIFKIPEFLELKSLIKEQSQYYLGQIKFKFKSANA